MRAVFVVVAESLVLDAERNTRGGDGSLAVEMGESNDNSDIDCVRDRDIARRFLG